jgi:hypothetical protein
MTPRRLLWPLATGAAAALVVVSSSGATHGSPDYLSNGHPISTPAGSSSLVACNVNNPCFTGRNDLAGDALTSAAGLKGELAAADTAFGSAAVVGENKGDDGYGVEGIGSDAGVHGETADPAGTGVRGDHRPSSGGGGHGVRGHTWSTHSSSVGVLGSANHGLGVFGWSDNSTGVYGLHVEDSGTAPGVLGETRSTAADARAVRGEVVPTNPGPGSAAVRGANNGTAGNGYGVHGSQAGSGIGVFGTTPGGFGVAGSSGLIGLLGHSESGWAGYFLGTVHVAGTLTKSAGSFRIDHPLAPATKYLQHSFVESPDMKNVYDGVVTTDRRGFATVRLPRYFSALNRSFRYQLTIVGSRGWRARVVREIARNRFTIQSDEPNAKVSWQVTGIRKDTYANAHRIRPELDKSAAEQGTYLHPELHGRRSADALVQMPRR